MLGKLILNFPFTLAAYKSNECLFMDTIPIIASLNRMSLKRSFI